MNPELEALVRAYDAVIESRGGEDHARLQGIFDSRLDEFLEDHTRFEKEMVQRVIREAHRRWIIAQRRPSTLPPKA